MLHKQSAAVGGKINVTLPPVDMECHLELAVCVEIRGGGFSSDIVLVSKIQY